MKKKVMATLCTMVMVMLGAVPGWAHFQTLIPASSLVTSETPQTIHLELRFMHPFEGSFMNMEKPVACGVALDGKKEDLLGTLKEVSLPEGLKGWDMDYKVKKPGDYIFYVTPQPYWEPAEDCYIIHNTKVVVDAFAMDEGWNEPVGLRAEIVPLTRPYGLWEGNLFRAQVLVEGVPAAKIPVEIEYFNTGDRKVPADVFVTQVVETDEQGIFSYSVPWGGWWGFAALTEAPETMKDPQGRDVGVELGAVMWVHFESLRSSLK